MKHVSYTIPGVVDEKGDLIVFGGFAPPGHDLPATYLHGDDVRETPNGAVVVNERDVKLPEFMPAIEKFTMKEQPTISDDQAHPPPQPTPTPTPTPTPPKRPTGG